jgi:tetrahydromethanopterin S-methyltransferase subunit C
MRKSAGFVVLVLVLLISFFTILIIFAPRFAGGLIAGSMIGSLLGRYGVNTMMDAIEVLEKEKRRNEGKGGP